MNKWESKTEDASIVLVGNMNPVIFHPEWFINRGILDEWEYTKDLELINVPELSQLALSGERRLQVDPKRFLLHSALASEHFALSDLIANTFTVLSETPITHIGLNLTIVLQIHRAEDWRVFGSQLAPQKHWLESAEYLNDLDKDKLNEFGLWDLQMNLPRPDDFNGFIRPKITVLSTSDRTLSFSVNDHIVIEDQSAKSMIEILQARWPLSLNLSRELINQTMNNQLQGPS